MDPQEERHEHNIITVFILNPISHDSDANPVYIQCSNSKLLLLAWGDPQYRL